MHQLQTISKHPPQEDILSARKSLVESQHTKPRTTKPTVTATTAKTQSLPKTAVIRNSEPSSSKPKVTTNGRRTPTSSIGVNGIKNNVDTSRKLLSVPTTIKRPPSMNELTGVNESIPISTIIEQPIIISERIDSINGGSHENIHRFDQRHDEHLSP